MQIKGNIDFLKYTTECILVTLTEIGNTGKERTAGLGCLITFDYGQVDFEESLLLYQIWFSILTKAENKQERCQP